MTKNEFLSRLEAELEARRVPEPEDILGEYRRHFEYKLADGYSEEEIAARLGAPEELAAQFEPEREAPHPSRAGSAARSALTWTGLVFADMFVLRQHRTIAEASAVESPIRQETIGFPAHFFARAHNFKPPGRACQPEADSPMRT